MNIYTSIKNILLFFMKLFIYYSQTASNGRPKPEEIIGIAKINIKEK